MEIPTFPPVRSNPVGSIVILDHLNINHEKGRHELLRAFYFDFLGCAVAPRKEENLARGTKTLWANVGFSQFHLPEGRPGAQVFDGIITLVYRTLKGWLERHEKDKNIRSTLEGTQFRVEEREDEDDNRGSAFLLLTDPWRSIFRIIAPAEGVDPQAEVDPRGTQGGGQSEGLALKDLSVHCPAGSNFGGIARFYERVFAAPVLSYDEGSSCVISVGPRETLTFEAHPNGPGVEVSHEDMVDG